METDPGVTLRKDRCLFRQVQIGHACGKGCGLIDDGGLDNIDGVTREKCRQYIVTTERDRTNSAFDVIRTIQADRVDRKLPPLPLTEENLNGHVMCSVAYNRVRTVTQADWNYDAIWGATGLPAGALQVHERWTGDDAAETYATVAFVGSSDTDEEEEEEGQEEAVQPKCDRCGYTTKRPGFSLKSWSADRGGGAGLMRCRNRDGQPVGARCKEVNVTVGAVISSTVTEPEPEREQTGKRRREDTPATAPKRARDRPLVQTVVCDAATRAAAISAIASGADLQGAHAAATAATGIAQEFVTHPPARRAVAARNLELENLLIATGEELDALRLRMDSQAGQKRVYRSRLQEARAVIAALKAEKAAAWRSSQPESNSDEEVSSEDDMDGPLQGMTIDLKEHGRVPNWLRDHIVDLVTTEHQPLSRAFDLVAKTYAAAGATVQYRSGNPCELATRCIVEHSLLVQDAQFQNLVQHYRGCSSVAEGVGASSSCSDQQAELLKPSELHTLAWLKDKRIPVPEAETIDVSEIENFADYDLLGNDSHLLAVGSACCSTTGKRPAHRRIA